MKVINLAAWVGHHFDFAHGALINLPRDIAVARREAGLVRDATAEEVETMEAAVFPGFVDEEEVTPVLKLDAAPQRQGKRR